MDAWKNCVLSVGKTHCHKILVLGGGGVWGFGGGGWSADFIFMGARIFLNLARTRLLKIEGWELWGFTLAKQTRNSSQPQTQGQRQNHLLEWPLLFSVPKSACACKRQTLERPNK